MCTLFCPQFCTLPQFPIFLGQMTSRNCPRFTVHPFCPLWTAVPWGSGSDPTATSSSSGPSPHRSSAADLVGRRPTWWSSRASMKPGRHAPPWTGNPWWRAHPWWCATGTAEKKGKGRAAWCYPPVRFTTARKKKVIDGYRYIYQKHWLN